MRVPYRRVVTGVLVAVASVSLFTTASEGKSMTPARRGASCPAGMALITPSDAPARRYCIDKWEAGLVEVRGKREVPHPPYEPVGDRKVKAVSRAGIVPQGYISRNQAEGACKAANKRLCSGDEWQTACRGRKPTTFPYGDERKKGYCNDEGRAPLSRLHPDIDPYRSHQAMNDPRINQAPNTVARTGKFARCKNAFGVFDMVGNLHEWTADVNGTRGVFRGGYYQDTRINGDGCQYKTVAHDVRYHDYSTGFRCCADAR